MDMVRLRAAVEQVDREISALPATPAVLRGAWAQLVGALALAPAPATRDCPGCGMPGMREATLCGYCWKKLTPPAAGDFGSAASGAVS